MNVCSTKELRAKIASEDYGAELCLQHAMANIDALEMQIEMLRKDAERYRYLRNRVPAEVLCQVKSASGCWIDGEDEEGVLMLLTGDDADAAVDASMLAARSVGAA